MKNEFIYPATSIKAVEAIASDAELDIIDKRFILAAFFLDDDTFLVSPLKALLDLYKRQTLNYPQYKVTLREKTMLVCLNRAAQSARLSCEPREIGRLMMDLVDYFTQGKVFSKNRYNADIFNFYKAEIDDFNRLWDREAKISEARAAARSKRQVYYVSRDKQLLNDYRLQAFKNAASLNILFNNGLNLAEYQAKANYQFKRLLSVWPGKIGSKYYCRKIFTADMEINLNFDRFLKQLDNFNSSHDPEYFKSPVSLEGYLRSVSYCHRGLIAK